MKMRCGCVIFQVHVPWESLLELHWSGLQLEKWPGEVSAASSGKQRFQKVQIPQHLAEPQSRARPLKYFKWMENTVAKLCKNLSKFKWDNTETHLCRFRAWILKKKVTTHPSPIQGECLPITEI